MSLAKAEELKRQYDACKAEREKLKTAFKDIGKSLLPFDINAFYQNLHSILLDFSYKEAEELFSLINAAITTRYSI